MNSAHLQPTLFVRGREVCVTPQVKSGKTCELFNAVGSGNPKTAKSADPTCYNSPASPGKAGPAVGAAELFDNVEKDNTMTERYQSVNGAWPAPPSQLPKLTAAEATTAAKRLWKLVTGKKLGKPIRITSGNRRNRNRIDALVLNPESGWWSLLHSLSHYATWKLYPGSKPHDDKGRHAFVERTMIEHVVNSGWLDGKLKRPKRPKAEIDRQAIRHQRILERIEIWTAKRRRADNALRKLNRQRAYYERAVAA